MDTLAAYRLLARENWFYSSDRGSLSVKDLWHIDLTEINKILENLASQRDKEKSDILGLQRGLEESRDSQMINALYEVAYDIGTHRQKEIEDSRNRAVLEAKRQKALEILEERQFSEMKNFSDEELLAMTLGKLS